MGKCIAAKIGKSQTGALLVQVLQYHYFLVVSAFFEREFPCLYCSGNCTFQRGFRLQISVCVAFHYFSQWLLYCHNPPPPPFFVCVCIQHYLRCFPHHISNVSECNCKQHSVPAFHIGRSNFYACNSNLPLSYSFPAALCSGLLFYADTMETSLVMTEVGMLLSFAYLSLQVEYAFLAAKH